jgi:hypothetical protein
MATKATGLFKSAKLIWLGIAVLLVFVFVGTLTLLKSVYQTETYYVLNQDIPTRTQITMDMLEPVVTSAGTAPGGSPDMTQEQRDDERNTILTAVQSGVVFSQFPMVSGDVLSPSNAGGLSDISVGVPDTWVITNFAVGADNAVGGRIQRGYYFDMMVLSDQGAFYPFVNVLALDTTTDLDSASSADAVNTEEAQEGQTTQYTVGMSPANAAKMQDLIYQYGGNIRMVLSPRQNDYAAPRLMDYSGLFKYDIDIDGVVAPGLQPVYDADGNPVDLDGDGNDDFREATDYTFTDVERDQFGRPIAQVDNVGLGNAKTPASAAEGAVPTNPNSDEGGVVEEPSSSSTGNSGATEDAESPSSTPVPSSSPEDETSGADSNG